MSKEDALKFARQITQKFNEETETFRECVSSWRLYRRRMISCEMLSLKLHVLFKGHGELIEGMHKFFPDDHKCLCVGSGTSLPQPLEPLSESDGGVEAVNRKNGVSMNLPPPQLPLLEPLSDGCVSRRKGVRKTKKYDLSRLDKEKEECFNYLDRVNKRLKNNEKFKEFLDKVLEQRHDKEIDGLDRELRIMFQDMPELHIEFTRFFVSKEEEEESMMTQRPPSPHRNSKKRKIRKNPYQKILFDCEDEMFEADMTFHLLQSTKESVERYLKYKRGIETEQDRVEEEEFFQNSHKRQIRNLYLEGLGEKMLNKLLNRHPTVAGEDILGRLEQKIGQFKVRRDKQNEFWKESFKINHEKAINFNPSEKKEEKMKI